VEVWKDTLMKSNENLCIPNGEEIMVSKENILTSILIYKLYFTITNLCKYVSLFDLIKFKTLLF